MTLRCRAVFYNNAAATRLSQGIILLLRLIFEIS